MCDRPAKELHENAGKRRSAPAPRTWPEIVIVLVRDWLVVPVASSLLLPGCPEQAAAKAHRTKQMTTKAMERLPRSRVRAFIE